jgi:hypothetical protein
MRTANTGNAGYKGPGYSGQNPAVYIREFLETVKQQESFVIRKMFKIKK